MITEGGTGDWTEFSALIANDFRQFNGTVSLITNDLSCIDGNARFTTVPLKSQI